MAITVWDSPSHMQLKDFSNELGMRPRCANGDLHIVLSDSQIVLSELTHGCQGE